jgi:aminoglycoside 2'-N-acetyltransferase I
MDGGAGIDAERIRLRRAATQELSPAETAAIRELLSVAFGDDEDERFDEDDWRHAVGGTHVLLELDGELVGHASVVERDIHVAGQPLRTGYVEAVATAPGRQGLGLGTLLMVEVGRLIEERYELGALGTGRHAFYERLGWCMWRGPSSVRTPDGERRTQDEDGYILVLPTPTGPLIDLAAPISCDWRPGDVW